MTSPTLCWLRRDLRLHDNAALSHALKSEAPVQVVFIFDTDILEQFPDKNDRRLSFIASTLVHIDKELKKNGGSLLVLHGSAAQLVPQLADALHAVAVFAAQDYEPGALKRDSQVKKTLQAPCTVDFVKDQVIFMPRDVLKNDGNPYKVYTPYSKAWLNKLTPDATLPYHYALKGRLTDSTQIQHPLEEAGLTPLDCSQGEAAMLEQIGYIYAQDPLWQPQKAQSQLKDFIRNKAENYAVNRNFMAMEGTSRISPYLRFGLLSVRECARAALEVHASTWLGELIWREFYAMILYYYPDSVKTEWNPRYRGTIEWMHNEEFFQRWCEGKTGYPLVDAAMRQLVKEGWMHNRCRMIVASFLTKHLLIDWRKGEAFFARYLMDYELASNVGGWQWAASTGTDAQPYFRIFNPIAQSVKFDPEGNYIRKYVPELRKVEKRQIHEPDKYDLLVKYYPPIVEQGSARKKAIEAFRLQN